MKTLLRHEDIATTSNVYGNVGMEAKRRMQQRLVKFVKERAQHEAERRQARWQPASTTIQ